MKEAEWVECIQQAELKCATKAAKCECKRVEKKANCTTRTAKGNATIVRMMACDSSYHKIALAMGKGLRDQDINSRWHRELKESSGIIKQPVKTSPHSSITWTA